MKNQSDISKVLEGKGQIRTNPFCICVGLVTTRQDGGSVTLNIHHLCHSHLTC